MANDKVDDQPGLRQSDGHVEELTKKIDALERERDGLVNEIAGRKTEINKLTLAIDVLREDEPKMREKLEGLEREFERSQVATKAAEVVAARNAGLEIEVSRLSRDSVSKKSAVEEARTECAKLRTVLQEKESMVSDLKWEVEELKQAKLEIEKKARELEKKIGVLEMKEIEEKSKKIRVEEELREEIDEKEKEIRGVRHKLEKLQRLLQREDLNWRSGLRKS
ncbi:peroxisomal and mitochondrial division factor 2-like [Prosopis cineraria]|uniref:peroxisomal and mitochondrial division factor 2-like n=1 Tax=Prosopis cineraria TaxID=364024 RepID=UPI00240FD6AB|nr:peroxisomal and mitochondrial division factor 2-like [Prosopis cineraria]